MTEFNTVEQSEIKRVMTNMIVEKGQRLDASVERDGHIGLTWENLVDFCEQVSPSDQAAIIEMLTKIDFNNGDVFHYLNFLMDGMVASVSAGVLSK
jgi:hypothetical protein